MGMQQIRNFLCLLLMSLTCMNICAEGRLFKKVPSVDGQRTDAATVYDIARTGDGFVWLATDRGLLRFDGEHTIRVTLCDDPQDCLVVKVIEPVEGGGVIAGAGNRLYMVRTEEGHHKVRPLLDGKPFPATCGLRVQGKYTLVGGDEGLAVIYADGNVRRIQVGNDLLDLSNKIIDISFGDGRIFLLTKGSIFRMNPDDFKLEQIGPIDTIDTLGATTITFAKTGLYIGTSGNGIWRLDPTTGQLKETFTFSKGNVVTDMVLGYDGSHLYVGTDGGGVTKIELPSERIVSQSKHVATDPVSPSNNQVYSLFTDRGGHLWVGYYQNGADYTPSWTGPFELMDDPAVINTRGLPVRALAITDKDISIGTREGLTMVARDSSETWTVRIPDLRSEMVISLLGHDDDIYIGTYGGGLSILDPRTRRVRDIAVKEQDPVFRNGHIFALASDKTGNLWIGTNRGLYRRSVGGTLTHYTSSNSVLPEGNVYGIFFDSTGKGWICTDTGLCVYDPRQDKLRTDLFPATFPRTIRYRTVYEDSRGRLYFVPEYGMVISSSPDLSDAATLSHPLFDDAVAKGVTEDKNGNLWIATSKGIFRRDSHGHVIRFGLASGLPSPIFLQAQPVSDDDDHIWFGNSEGLLRLTESEISSSIEAQRSPVPTTLNINGSMIDHVFVPDDKSGKYKINIDRPSTTVKIGFSTFTYALEEPDSYVYSLDGGEWKPFEDELAITFYDLSPGRHDLRVKSANDSEGEAETTVVDLRMPYPLWWFILGGLIIALAATLIIIGVLHIRRRNYSRASLDKENEEEGGAASADVTPQDDASRTQKKYATNVLSRTEAREISRKLDEIMERDKPYLQTNLKVGDLAALAGISSHRLSQFFSQHKGQNFYDYINYYRVQEFKRIAKSDSTRRNLTLTAMSEMAGFSSRATFFRYFKNLEGISPGEWFKNLE